MDINRCFEILEISPNATYEEAKTAYRLMAQVWHPDKHAYNEKLHAKATSKAQEINAAWSEIDNFFKSRDNRGADERNAEHQAREERERAQKTEQEWPRKEDANKDSKKSHAKQPRPEHATSKGSYGPFSNNNASSPFIKVIFSIIAVIVVVVIFSNKEKPESLVPSADIPTTHNLPKSTESGQPSKAPKVQPQNKARFSDDEKKMSQLSSTDQLSIELACTENKAKGSDGYIKCVNERLSSIKPTHTPPKSSESAQPSKASKVQPQNKTRSSDEKKKMSQLSSTDQLSIELACTENKAKGSDGYIKCVNERLSSIRR